MLVQNNFNTPNFTALRIDSTALGELQKLPVKKLIQLDKAGREFMGYKYAGMHIQEKAVPKVTMHWHDFEANYPFQVKLSPAGDRVELSGQHVYDHPGRHSAGDPAKENILFDSGSSAKSFLQKIKELNPIEAAINLTKALEKSNEKELARTEEKLVETVGAKNYAYALVNKYTPNV